MKKKMKSGDGVALIEATITLPLFILILFFLIDIARYLFITIWLHYTAYVAVDNLSKSIETATYVDQSSCQANKANLTACQNFKTKLIKLRDLISGKIQVIGGGVKLHSFRMYPSSPDVTLDSVLAIVRPGEEIIDIQTNQTIQHPVRIPGGCSPLDNIGTPCTNRGETWLSVLNSNPIISLIIADVDTITPIFMGKVLTIKAMQMGIWRGESPHKGKLGPTVAPLPTYTPTNRPTPTPTLTPTSTPTATLTTTSTPTPTPTISATGTSCPPKDCGIGDWNQSACACECYNLASAQYCANINPNYIPVEDPNLSPGCKCACDTQSLEQQCGYDYDITKCVCNTPAPTATATATEEPPPPDNIQPCDQVVILSCNDGNELGCCLATDQACINGLRSVFDNTTSCPPPGSILPNNRCGGCGGTICPQPKCQGGPRDGQNCQSGGDCSNPAWCTVGIIPCHFPCVRVCS